ncbi:hypothetical protein GCM10007079_20640 [Nocardiopsis terrae]|uniref:MmyB family transcriptional regulator n=1 Tax=Nocardiopsis terrae TaxID=372655 RepID=UPI00198AC5A4|nr:hypothetical protein GCM10007079_20640 [Nocardiopsis terrae]
MDESGMGAFLRECREWLRGRARWVRAGCRRRGWVRATMRALLDRLEPTPAALFNRLGETLAYTAGYEAVGVVGRGGPVPGGLPAR